MKKILNLLSLLLAVVFIFSACNAAPEIAPEYSSNSSKGDLDGFVLHWGLEGSEANTLGYRDNTNFEDMAIDRLSDVESALNCEIELYYSSAQGINSNLTASVMSGSHQYDLVRAASYYLAPNARSGHLLGLSGMLDVQNTEKWGTPRMLQSMFWKDDLFGVVPFAWPELLYSCFGHPIGVNEVYIAQLGATDPREYVETKTWNWDKFEEVLQSYTFDVNGTPVYSMYAHEPYFIQMMMLSNGSAMSAYENGKVVMGAYTEAGKVALERAKSIFNETCSDYIHPYTGTDYSLILKGEVVMSVAWAGEFLGNYVYALENLGILPFPQGPNATPGVYLTYHDSMPHATGIPINSSDAEAAAMILTELYEPFEGYETKDEIIDYMSDQVFFSRQDAEVFLNMVRNTEYGFFREGARKVLDAYIDSSESITSVLEAHEVSIGEVAEKTLTPHYQGMIAIFGE